MGAAFWRLTLVASLLAFLNGTGGRAGTILVIGNYPQVNDATFSTVASLDGAFSKAVGFTMPGQSVTLDSITLRLKQQAGSSNTLTVALFGGSNGGPSGPSLVGFDTPSIPPVAGDVTFRPTENFLLTSNTTYWLELTGTSNTLNGIVWYASNSGIAPTGIATAAGARFDNKANALSAMATSSLINTFQVTGRLDPEGVPEPPGLIQAFLAVAAGLAYAGCRSGRSSAARSASAHRRDGREGPARRVRPDGR